MESYFDWAKVEAQIPTDGIEHLRGDKEFIAFVKEDIKQRSANTSVYRRKHREWFSKMDRGLEAGEPPYRDGKTPHPTSKCLMRHIFLAYGWLRYKPLSKVEPNTKEFKTDQPLYVPSLDAADPTWKSYFRSYDAMPSPTGIAKVIEWYEARYEAAKKECREAG